MKMPLVREKAKDLGLRPGNMKKIDLIRAIQSQEGNSACYKTGRTDCDQMLCCWREECLPTH